MEPDWAHFYLTNIGFFFYLSQIYLFTLELAVASSRVWCMQGGKSWTCLCSVCRYVGEGVKLLVSYYLSFIYREVFLYSNNSPVFRLLHPKAALILE